MRPTATLPGMIVFVAALLASVATFVYLIESRFALLRAVKPSARFDRWGERWAGVLRPLFPAHAEFVEKKPAAPSFHIPRAAP